jgi:hypothetical protein
MYAMCIKVAITAASVIALTLLIGFYSQPLAQQGAAIGKVQGVVEDDPGARIPEVTVVFDDSKTKYEATSDDAGEFSVELPANAYQVAAAYLGLVLYRRKRLLVKADKTVKLKVVLELDEKRFHRVN